MKTIFFLFALLCLASCHRNLTRSVTIQDTVRVVIPSVHVDTLAPLYSAVHDTLVINKNNVTTKVHIHKDSIYVVSDYKGDTLVKIIEKKVLVNCPDFTAWQAIKRYWRWLLLFVFLVFILYVVGIIKK